MQNYTMIQNGEKKIFELSEKELAKYDLIGTAAGFSFGFCMYLGWKHSKNFMERVCGYRIVKHVIGEMMSQTAREAGIPKEKQEYITVSFYEVKIH